MPRVNGLPFASKWSRTWQPRERSSLRLAFRAARASIRTAHRDFVFGRAISRFARAPAKATLDSSGVLEDLIYGWGNESYSAQREYLAACVESALRTNGAILECGSGLTTLLLGIVAQQRRLPVWALEHLPAWAARVQEHLDRLRVESVRIHVAPLRHYNGFDWYDPPLRQMPRQFTLVACDGPPGATYGGRYGLLPVMTDRLDEQCVILVDDAERDAEQSMVERWADERPCAFALHGDQKPYFSVRLNDH